MKRQQESRQVLVLLGLGLLISHLGNSPTFAAGREILVAAFDESKDATTVEACTKIIETCTAVKPSELSLKMADYRSKLLAWAHNRRGELYASEAAADSESPHNLDSLAFEDFDASLRYDEEHWKPWHNRGVSHALLGRHEAAIEDLTEALQRKPDDADTRFNRATILADSGRPSAALQDFDDLLRVKPDDFEAVIGRAAARRELGQLQQALADCEQAIQIDPNSAVALTQRGKTYESLGNWSAAATDFRRAVQMNRHSAEANLAAAWLMATCPDDRFRNPSLAVEAAERGTELISQAGRWKADDVAAAAYAAAGRFDLAEQRAARALAASPTAARAGLEIRLQGFRDGRPFRQAAATTLRGQLGEGDG